MALTPLVDRRSNHGAAINHCLPGHNTLRPNRASWCCLLLAAAGLACGSAGVTPAAPTAAQALLPLPALVTSPVASAARALTLGTQYAVPGLAASYAATGVTAVKPQLEFVSWGNLEPKQGQWQWGPLDNLVIEYQAAGFSHMQLLLSAESPWASRAPGRDLMPKDEFQADYVRYVTQVVERYDGDGLDDAPGLLFPVHEFGVELEFSQFFPWRRGRLPETAQAGLSRHPRGRSRRPRFCWSPSCSMTSSTARPTPAEVERRLADTPPFRKPAADIRAILAACDVYDIVDFHSLGDYTEIPPTAAWLDGPTCHRRVQQAHLDWRRVRHVAPGGLQPAPICARHRRDTPRRRDRAPGSSRPSRPRPRPSSGLASSRVGSQRGEERRRRGRVRPGRDQPG